MKKIFLIFLLFHTLAEAAEIEQAGVAPREETKTEPEWEITYKELENPVVPVTSNSGGVSSLLLLAAARLSSDGISKLFDKLQQKKIQSPPDELYSIITQKWFKQNYDQLIQLRLISAPPIKLNNNIHSLAVLQDGDILIGSQSNEYPFLQSVRILDGSTGALKRTLIDNVGVCERVNVLPNGYIAKSSRDGLIILDSSAVPRYSFSGLNADDVKSCTLLPGGDIVIGLIDSVMIIDSGFTRIKYTIPIQVSCLIVLANGDIVVGSINKAVTIWNSQTGKLNHTLTGHTGAITSLAELPNGNLVTGSLDGTAKIWDNKTFTIKRTLATPHGAVESLAVWRNGDIATGTAEKVTIWDNATGIAKHTIDGCGRAPQLLAVLPSGDIVMASGYDAKICALSPRHLFKNPEEIKFSAIYILEQLCILARRASLT